MTLLQRQTKNLFRRINIITLIVACLLSFGCQATPQKEPVVNKQEDYLIGKEQPVFTKYDAPGHVGENKKVNGLRMVFDADVMIPEVDGYAVAEVEQ
ncbi:MAG TPA: DUF6034 family protein [Clostridia bacterium]|nr:DUF6034 family protein [Clostridia bacterium]